MESTWQVVWRVGRRVLVVDVGLAIAAALLVVFTQPFTLGGFSSALILIGALGCCVGFLATVGDFQLRGDWRYQFGRSVSDASLPERTQQEMHERSARESASTVVAIAGLVAIALGALIRASGL